MPQNPPATPGAAPSFNQKLDARKKRRDNEMQLWHAWKGGDEAALEPLFQSLTPLMKRHTMSFRGNLPESYVDAMVKKHTMDALHSYDPGANAQLNTHITHRLQKVKRDVAQYQNPGRLAEGSHWNVPFYEHTQANLQSDLGREPTHEEIGKAMDMRPDEVARLASGTRRDLAAVEGQNRWKPDEKAQQQALLEDFSHELDPLEQRVLFMTFGMKGHPQAQAKEIAQTMGITPGRVSQLRQSIFEKFQKQHASRNTEATPVTY